MASPLHPKYSHKKKTQPAKEKGNIFDLATLNGKLLSSIFTKFKGFYLKIGLLLRRSNVNRPTRAGVFEF